MIEKIEIEVNSALICALFYGDLSDLSNAEVELVNDLQKKYGYAVAALNELGFNARLGCDTCTVLFYIDQKIGA